MNVLKLDIISVHRTPCGSSLPRTATLATMRKTRRAIAYCYPAKHVVHANITWIFSITRVMSLMSSTLVLYDMYSIIVKSVVTDIGSGGNVTASSSMSIGLGIRATVAALAAALASALALTFALTSVFVK